MPDECILIVEDDRGLSALLKEHLESLGYGSVQAYCAADAMAMLKSRDCVLVLMDYALPDAGGGELVRELQALELPPPFVVITGHGSEQVAVSMMKGGARDYLVKDSLLLERLGPVITRVLQQSDTERRLARAEASLRESEERWKFALESTAQGVWDWDLVEDRAYFSPGWLQIAGLQEGEAGTGLEPWLMRVHPEDRPFLADALRRHLAGEAHDFASEHRLRHGTTGYRWYFSMGKVIARDAAGKPLRMIGTLQDTTERHELAERLQHTQKLESLGVMAAGVAHDFNNLLMVVIGHADMLLKTTPATDPRRVPLEEIRKAAMRSAELSRQMLTYAGKSTVVLHEVCIHTLIQAALPGFRRALPVNITLRVDLAAQLPMVKADAAQFQTLLGNLVDNAREAIGEAPGRIVLRTGRVYLSADDLRDAAVVVAPGADGYAFLAIEDTGCGMDADTRERMFDPFFSTKFPGRGLGLPTVLGIVRGHGGTVKVTSEPGAGTTVTVYFPALAGPAGVSAPDAGATVEDLSCSGRRGILVVDDEAGIRRMIQKVLERAGYQVYCAANGAEGLALFKEKQELFALVLLDLKMLPMDGEAMMGGLRALDPHIPVIISTGYPQEGRQAALRHLGFAAMLEKPYSPRSLLEMVQRTLAKQSVR